MNAVLSMVSDTGVVRMGEALDYVLDKFSEPVQPPAESARDPRRLNRMAPELQVTHHNLVEWAKIAGSDIAGIGWPAKSLLGRLIEQGPNGLSQGSAPVLSISEDDMATDSAVAHLGEIDRKVIWAYYVDWHKAREGKWWKLAGMNEKPANRVLNRARWRVNGYRAGWYRRKI